MRSWIGFLGLLAFLPLLSGCGASNVKVTGHVSWKGKPLPGGQVTLRPLDPKYNSVMVALDEEGNFEATLPTGEVQVSVDNRALQPRSSAITMKIPTDLSGTAKQALGRNKGTPAPADAGNTATQIPGKYVPIPSKYYRVDTSELQYKIDATNNKLTIELN